MMKYPLYKKHCTNSSKKPTYSTRYNDLINSYNETNFLVFLTEAYLFCRENDYELPEEILCHLDKLFSHFNNAKSKNEGLAALGFDNNYRGGAWQGKAARDNWNQAQIISLCEDMLVLGETNKTKVFQCVEGITGFKFGHIKKLYYANKRRVTIPLRFP